MDGKSKFVLIKRLILLRNINISLFSFIYHMHHPDEPWLCPSVLQKKYMQKGIGEHYAMFMGMMEQLDKQVGRILQTIEDLDISKNTIVLF